MEQLMKDYGRLLLLEGKLPELEEEKETARREALAAKRSLDEKLLAWRQWQEPGFWQRLLGKTEEKRDKACREYQEAEKAFRLTRRKEEAAAGAAEKAKAEMEALEGTPERYLREKETGDREKLAELAPAAFGPAALAEAQRCLGALEAARDIYHDPVKHGLEYRRTEYFAQAEAAAKQLLWLLEQFSEPEAWICPYLRNPNGYLLMATEYTRRDRLNEAIAQVREIQNRLKQEI